MKGSIEHVVDEQRVGTYLIAQGFNREHKKILELVRNYEESFLELGVIPTKRLGSTGGRPANSLMLNESQVMLLMSLIRNTSQKTKVLTKFIKLKGVIDIIKILKDFDFGDEPKRFVYAMQDDIGNIKIGISNDPERRLKELNLGSALGLKLIFTKTSTGTAYSDEKELHNSCAPYHIRSEWFTTEARRLLEC